MWVLGGGGGVAEGIVVGIVVGTGKIEGKVLVVGLIFVWVLV